MDRPLCRIIYAIAIVALRDTPAWQCTNTLLPAFRASSVEKKKRDYYLITFGKEVKRDNFLNKFNVFIFVSWNKNLILDVHFRQRYNILYHLLDRNLVELNSCPDWIYLSGHELLLHEFMFVLRHG